MSHRDKHGMDEKPFRLYVKVKHSISREFQSLVVQGKKLDIDILVTSRNGDKKSCNLSE